jgi:hypothetical protein
MGGATLRFGYLTGDWVGAEFRRNPVVKGDRFGWIMLAIGGSAAFLLGVIALLEGSVSGSPK